MLGEIEARIRKLVVTARPKSRWHYLWQGFWPYIQGQKADFEVLITATEDLPATTRLFYSVENTGNLQSWTGYFELTPMRKGEHVKHDSIKIPLYRTGDSIFVVWHAGDEIKFRQGAFIFHTTSRNTIFLTVLGIIVTATVAWITIN